VESFCHPECREANTSRLKDCNHLGRHGRRLEGSNNPHDMLRLDVAFGCPINLFDACLSQTKQAEIEWLSEMR
jgi:hypothetical protein